MHIDTGAEQTMVNSELVRDSEYTGETINLRSYSGEVNRHPLAIVWVNVGKYSVRKEVAMCGSEVLLGTDLDFSDYLVELAKEVRDQEIPRNRFLK